MLPVSALEAFISQHIYIYSLQNHTYIFIICIYIYTPKISIVEEAHRILVGHMYLLHEFGYLW